MLNEKKLARLEEALKIDVNDLDRCLIEQSEHYYHVAVAYEEAVSIRDEAKLRLEQETAKLDRQVRESLKEKEKLTETAIHNRLLLMPKIKDLNDELLEAREYAARLAALKESFRDRSFMLRELNARQLAQWHDTGLDRSVSSTRSRRAEAVEAASGRMRRKRLGDED